jgi:hypothetical protein
MTGAWLDVPWLPAFIFWSWFAGVFAAGWVTCWLVSRFGWVALVLVALLMTGIIPAMAADEKPSTWFCMKARAHRAAFPTDRAAEDAARAQGISEETIARAKLCRR